MFADAGPRDLVADERQDPLEEVPQTAARRLARRDAPGQRQEQCQNDCCG
jgi:hypothetical protein